MVEQFKAMRDADECPICGTCGKGSQRIPGAASLAKDIGVLPYAPEASKASGAMRPTAPRTSVPRGTGITFRNCAGSVSGSSFTGHDVAIDIDSRSRVDLKGNKFKKNKVDVLRRKAGE